MILLSRKKRITDDDDQSLVQAFIDSADRWGYRMMHDYVSARHHVKIGVASLMNNCS